MTGTKRRKSKDPVNEDSVGEREVTRRASIRERGRPEAYSPTGQDAEAKRRRTQLKSQEKEEPESNNAPAEVKIEDIDEREDDDDTDDVPLRSLKSRSKSIAVEKLQADEPEPKRESGEVQALQQGDDETASVSDTDSGFAVPIKATIVEYPDPFSEDFQAKQGQISLSGTRFLQAEEPPSDLDDLVPNTIKSEAQMTESNRDLKAHPSAGKESLDPANPMSDAKLEGLEYTMAAVPEQSIQQVAATDPTSEPKAVKEGISRQTPGVQSRGSGGKPDAKSPKHTDGTSPASNAGARKGDDGNAAHVGEVEDGGAAAVGDAAVMNGRLGTEPALARAADLGQQADTKKQVRGNRGKRKSISPDSDAPLIPRSRQGGDRKAAKSRLKQAKKVGGEEKRARPANAGPLKKQKVEEAKQALNTEASIPQQRQQSLAQPLGKPAGPQVTADKSQIQPPPSDGSKEDIIFRRNKLAEAHKECTEAYLEAQRKTASLLNEMMAEIKYLEGLRMTEEALQQTGIGKIMNRLAKPMKPLQQLNVMEKGAGALLGQWMKAVEGTPKPPPNSTLPASAIGKPGNATGDAAEPLIPASGYQKEAGPSSRPNGTCHPPSEQNVNKAVGSNEGALMNRSQSLHQKMPVVNQQTSGKSPALQPTEAAKQAVPKAPYLQTPKAEESKAAMARRKARLFLERAFLPPEYVLPPQASARVLEEALHQHYSEEDLMSGKRYLRRLRALMEILEPGGAFYQPAVRQIIGQGKLHPADLACMSNKEILEEVSSFTTQQGPQ